MKKTILYTALLLTTALHEVKSDTGAHQQHGTNMVPKKVSFHNTIFNKMDGVDGVVDAETIYDCFRTVQMVGQLLQGVVDPKTGKKMGVFVYQGTHYTLKELVLMEDRLIKNNTKITDPEYVLLNNILKELKALFKQKSEPLLEKTKKPMIKAMNLKLIAIWIEQSGRHNSVLQHFGNDEVEMAALEQANTKEFYLFLNDLKCFLKDLIHSAPKACDMYKKECLQPADHEKFDAFVNS